MTHFLGVQISENLPKESGSGKFRQSSKTSIDNTKAEAEIEIQEVATVEEVKAFLHHVVKIIVCEFNQNWVFCSTC